MTGISAYTSLAVVEVRYSGEIAIETISFSPDSCVLSGAWILPAQNTSDLVQILNGRLLLRVGNQSQELNDLMPLRHLEVSIQEFIDEAREDAQSALVSFDKYVLQSEFEYAEYMSINPKDRKLLQKVVKKKPIPPNFFKWPTQIDLNQSSEYLQSVGHLNVIPGTPIKMKNVLTAARVIKYLVEMWHQDEIERSNRLYVVDQAAQVQILPSCWLSKIEG